MLRLAATLACVVAATLAAGCGGDDQTATEAWADDTCSAIVDWRQAVEDAVESLQSGSGSVAERAEAAVGDVSEATRTLADELGDLDPPRTEDGEAAQATVEELASKLRGDLTAIEAATADVGSASDALTAAAAVADALADMQRAIVSAVDELETTDPAGELREAFDDSDACRELRRERS